MIGSAVRMIRARPVLSTESNIMKIFYVTFALLLAGLGLPNSAHSLPSIGVSQSDPKEPDVTDESSTVISTNEAEGTDSAISERLRGIYKELGGLQKRRWW